MAMMIYKRYFWRNASANGVSLVYTYVPVLLRVVRVAPVYRACFDGCYSFRGTLRNFWLLYGRNVAKLSGQLSTWGRRVGENQTKKVHVESRSFSVCLLQCVHIGPGRLQID